MYGAVMVMLRSVGVLNRPQLAGSVTTGLLSAAGNLTSATGTRSHSPRSINAGSAFFGTRMLRGRPSAR